MYCMYCNDTQSAAYTVDIYLQSYSQNLYTNDDAIRGYPWLAVICTIASW